LLTLQFNREKMEQLVFTELLQMIPGLEDCLTSSSPEEVSFIAEMVCLDFQPATVKLSNLSYARVHLVHDLTTLEA
jgi:hypothetical protein